jgi:hypothetical protein
MSESLKRKTNPFTLQETPVPDNYFKCDVLPGRCRKEFSPGYKEHVLQSENSPKEFPALNESTIHRFGHFSIANTGRHLNKMLFGIIESIGRFLTRYTLRQTIVYADTINGNYNLDRKQIQK